MIRNKKKQNGVENGKKKSESLSEQTMQWTGLRRFLAEGTFYKRTRKTLRSSEVVNND